MRKLTIFLVFSSLVLVTSGWGDVIHYPEFIKYTREIGNYKEDPASVPEEEADQQEPRNIPGRKGVLS